MKAAAYPTFTTTAFQSRLIYRNQVWASAFGKLISSFAYIAIWTAAFAGAASVDGVTLPEMVTYVLMAGSMLYWNVDRLLKQVGEDVRTGDVTTYLIKPVYYPLYMLATHLGHYLFEQLVITLPVAIIIALVLGLVPPASVFHGTMFFVFWTLSWLTLFTLATLCGLLAFWLMTVFALEWLLKGIMALVSGAIVPLWFMPPALAAICGYLPFAWVSYYPSAVYLGKLDVAATWTHLGIGLAWLTVLGGFASWLWAKARNRLVVQGG